MAVFSNKIISTKFIDPPNNMMIELLYREDTAVIPYIVEVDFTSEDFNDLLKEVTLDQVEKTTQNQLKVEQDNLYKIIEEKVTEEVESRWAKESEKVKAAYDKAEQYAQEVIEKEFKSIDNAWKAVKEEYVRLESAWKSVEEESARIEKSWEQIAKESVRIEKSWEQIAKESANVEKSWEQIAKESANVEKSWQEIEGESGRVQKAWQEIEGESGRVQKAWQEIEQGYKKVDEYAEGEKTKKMEEVQSEFQKLRQELAVRFNTGTSVAKLEAKDLFQQLVGNEEDKDFVFNMKIAVLEDPDIAKSKDKTMKLAIRKAKSVTELLAIYYAQKAA